MVVLDSDDVRRRLRDLGVRGRWRRCARPLVHVGHLVRVVRAVSGAGPAVVVHETGTRPRVRRALARLASRAGRPCHALFLDVDPAQAQAGAAGAGQAARVACAPAMAAPRSDGSRRHASLRRRVERIRFGS